MKNTCVFCLNTGLEPKTVVRKGGAELKYWLCDACHGVFLDPASRLSAAEEKKRYTLHENTLADPGYRAHLVQFMNEVLSFPEIRDSGSRIARVHSVFDYGSGPEPCLARLFAEAGFEVRFRDPFFCPDTPAFDGGADLVTCLEVSEHFAEPRRDFALMASCVRDGGFLAVGTHLLAAAGVGADSGTDPAAVWDFFLPWWYRQDPTHVSFYTEKALRLAAESAGFEWLGPAGKTVRMFRKGTGVSR